MFGYHGKFLRVDLSKGEIEDMSLDSNMLQKYIGGSTLAARLIYEHVDKRIKSLDPPKQSDFCNRSFYWKSSSHGEPLLRMWYITFDRYLG